MSDEIQVEEVVLADTSNEAMTDTNGEIYTTEENLSDDVVVNIEETEEVSE